MATCPSKPWHWLRTALALIQFLLGPAICPAVEAQNASSHLAAIPDSVTYSKDVAPILFENCAACHRPGQAAPFALLTYADAKKHVRDIARVTAGRIMPPWLPEKGYGEFKGERRLADRQIAILQRWSEQDAPEGNPSDAPAPPQFKSDWQLGQPDLVVEPSEPFVLPAAGKDVYFNFVVPIQLPEKRYVSGVELLPGSPSVHHAFIFIDPTKISRRKGLASHPWGFEGMYTPESALMPSGQLLGWNPGKIPQMIQDGLFWELAAGSDLVLQTHLNPRGKPEAIRPRLGFHFTNQPPLAEAYRMWLTTLDLDIPPGASNYVAETTYQLPVDLAFLRVGAHAHYLCKKMEGYAILPNGEKIWLLLINDWNFQWQGDYEYKTPVKIPKNSKMVMRFTYDNSTNDVRNPSAIPKRVLWGPQTTDEMGELVFQCLPNNSADCNAIYEDFRQFSARQNATHYRFRLKENPADTDALLRLGRTLIALKQTADAIAPLQEAVRLEPTNDLPHFELGSIYLGQSRLSRAYGEFKEVVRLNPGDGQAYENIGIICTHLQRLDEAREAFENALRLDPENPYAKRYLQRLKTSATK